MQDNSTIIRNFIEETINQGQIDSAVQFVWEDVVEQVPFPGQGPGLEGLKDILRGMRAGFPDLHFSVEEQIAEGDKVLTRFEWTGTHRGESVSYTHLPLSWLLRGASARNRAAVRRWDHIPW